MTYEPAFNDAVQFTLVAEGVLSDNPNDAGGLTKFGITHETWDAYTVKNGLEKSSVADITVAQAIDVYHEFFWQPIAALPSELQGPAFDFGVNSGPEQAIRAVQVVLGVKADGELGPITIARAAAVKVSDLRKLRNVYVSARIAFLLELAQHHANDVTFIGGWFNRVAKLYDFAY